MSRPFYFFQCLEENGSLSVVIWLHAEPNPTFLKQFLIFKDYERNSSAIIL